IDEEIVAICSDGAGYGPDNRTWGGEILVGNAKQYMRAAYLKPQPMPGGDLAAQYPLRMLIGILATEYSNTELHEAFNEIASRAFPQGIPELETILTQLTQQLNTPLTSSTGRILDAIASMLQITFHRTYEGEPAIRFEAFANKGKPIPQLNLEIHSKQNGRAQVLDTTTFMNQLFQSRYKYPGPDLAHEAHLALGRAFGRTASAIAESEGLRAIGFSGGVAFNRILTRTIRQVVEDRGLELLVHRHVPPGDAGTSVGQGYAARGTLD
ncbi:MAG: carbamoyltransferase HypF, partial [Candidatus Hermodarchaeota archaeon]|nr:carbamoyltransferase HypF [Candidatus Hermodarchaeota archaeon]